MQADTRIVVTGIGLVTPLGNGVEENWRRLRAGESGIGPMTRLDPSPFPCQSSAAVPAYPPTALRAPKNAKFMNVGAAHLMQATLESIAAGGLDIGSASKDRIAVHTGSGQVGPEPSELFRAFTVAKKEDGSADFEQLGGHASRLVDPYFPLRTLSNSGTALVAMELGARGPSNNFVQGEVSSAYALNAACRDLRDRRCDYAIAAGFEFLLTPSNFLNYATQGLLSALPPDRAQRPFDREGDGLVLGEGAAAFLLERLSDATARGARPLAEITGIGFATGPEDILGPFHSGRAVAASLNNALKGAKPSFAVASGFGIPSIDCRELRVLADTLGDVPVTALKGQTGYLGCASTMAEIALGIAMLQDRAVMPIQRHENVLDGTNCRLVTGAPVALEGEFPMGVFLSQSWYGQCAAVCVQWL